MPSIVQQLREAADALPADRVSLDRLLQAQGAACQGSLVLLMAVPCMLPIPGTGTVLGFGLLAMALAMWRGDAQAALPGRVASLEMSGAWARKVLATLATIHAFAARVVRPRSFRWLPAEAPGFTAAGVATMAVVLILPIPFGNVLPALALVLIGLGQAAGDAVMTFVGLVAAVLTAALTTAGVLAVSVWGVEWLTRLVA